MRNVLVNDYFEVDFETAWQIVERDLPPLEKAMRVILAEIDEIQQRKCNLPGCCASCARPIRATK